jgi:hypothetical protein
MERDDVTQRPAHETRTDHGRNDALQAQGGTDPKLTMIVRRAVAARRKTIEQRPGGATRVLSGEADGLAGVYVDVFGDVSNGERGENAIRGGAAIVNVYEGRAPGWFDGEAMAATVLEAINAELPEAARVRAVYVKPFAKDRSRLGGVLPEVATRAQPSAGDAVPEALVIREHAWKLEVRMYDGLSTGLFLDQRENRGLVHQRSVRASRRRRCSTPLRTRAPSASRRPSEARSRPAWTFRPGIWIGASETSSTTDSIPRSIDSRGWTPSSSLTTQSARAFVTT